MDNRPIAVAGLAFGDEGKGAVVDYYTRRHNAALVVRFNGGPQAAHNVVTADGTHHTFSQFGAGTLAGARTFLSRHMLVNPEWMLREAAALTGKCGVDDPLQRIAVDPEALIITPYHIAANRELERRRGAGRHGSVGAGVGEVRRLLINEMTEAPYKADSWFDLRASMLRSRTTTLCRLEAILEHYVEVEQLFTYDSMPRPEEVYASYEPWIREVPLLAWADVASAVTRDGSAVVFEGAQGFLLDEKWGFAPHNSWTDCTFNNAVSLCDEAGWGMPRKVGVVRSYYTRHGAGPFPTENRLVARGVEQHNTTHDWMGDFRTGHFDGVLFNYAVDRAQPHEIAVTHTDIVSTPMVASAYRWGTDGDENLCSSLPNYLAGTPELTTLLGEVRPAYIKMAGPLRFFNWLSSRAGGTRVTLAFRGPTADHAERV